MKFIIKNKETNTYSFVVVVTSLIVPDGFDLIGTPEEHPEIIAEMEAKSNKEKQIQDLYNAMNIEVLAQMATVFGTSNTDSANANKQTWELMLAEPELFVPTQFKTAAEVTAYATSKLNAVKTYAVWRLTRISQFQTDKATIFNS